MIPQQKSQLANASDHFHLYKIPYTPAEKNSSPLKNDAWNTILLLGPGLFSGGELLNFRKEKSLHSLGSDHLERSCTDEAEKVASRIGHVGTARCSEVVQRAIGSRRLREKPDLTQGKFC